MERQVAREEGIAILSAIMLTIVIALVLVAIIGDQLAQSGSSARENQRTNSADAADAGVHALQQALYAQRHVQVDGFTVTPDDVQQAAAIAGGQVSPTGPQVHPSGIPTTVRLPEVEGSDKRAAWQVYALVQPTAEFPWLTAYVRGWIETGGGASQAVVQRVRLRPGSMADYQVISDVPIQLDPGVTINGRIHSNGYLDETVQPPRHNTNLRVWAQGAATCTSTAGVKPVVSAAIGDVGVAGAAGCTMRNATNKFVALNAARSTVDRLRAQCNNGYVVCTNDAGAAPGSRARVRLLGGNVVQVISARGASRTMTLRPDKGYAILTNRTTEVSGNVNGRLTIAAWSPANEAVEAPDIVIVGNTTRTAPTVTQGRALGLIAEHDIIVDHLRACTTTVSAAMIATTGSIALPMDVRTPTPVGTTNPCAAIGITGSLASHGSVALRWSWGAGTWTGFAQRRYVWDPWLAAVPPPYWPMTNPWEVTDTRRANGDCLLERGRRLTDAVCR